MPRQASTEVCRNLTIWQVGSAAFSCTGVFVSRPPYEQVYACYTFLIMHICGVYIRLNSLSCLHWRFLSKKLGGGAA